MLQEQVPSKESTVEIFQANILAVVGNIPTVILLDTGAAINVVSQTLFEQICTVYKPPTYPVQNCSLIGAIGTKSKNIKLKTQLQMVYGDHTDFCTFLIVDGLLENCILGLEYLRNREACINFKTGKCYFTINKKVCAINLIKSKSMHGKYCHSKFHYQK